MNTAFRPLCVLACAVACALLFSAPARAGLLDNRLAILQPLIDREWVGHYVGSADSSLTHKVHWETILDGKAVKKTKSVPDADFEGHTFFFWDESKGAVAFLSLNNRGRVSWGVLGESQGRVVEHGIHVAEGDTTEYKLSFEVLPDGRLRDVFERMVDGAWREGHIIEYRAQGR